MPYFWSRSPETAKALEEMDLNVAEHKPYQGAILRSAWPFTYFGAKVSIKDFARVFDELIDRELTFWTTGWAYDDDE